jgi:hypothetical protein
MDYSRDRDPARQGSRSAAARGGIGLSLIERLHSIGVAPCSNDLVADYRIQSAAALKYKAIEPPASERPLVSCLMVTRGNLDLMRHSVECYVRQSWAERELVVVTDVDRTQAVGDLLRAFQLKRAQVVGVGPGMTLGDLRNIAIARAKGAILIQWDDDDLSDPDRIAIAARVLQREAVGAVFLDRWLLWWPSRQLAALAYPRACEGSVAMWRRSARVYPAQAKGEDTLALNYLDEPVALINSPLQYVYTITGENTWDEAHFEAQVAAAEHRFEGDDYHALIALLAERLPIVAYEADLRRMWACRNNLMEEQGLRRDVE